MKTVSFRSALGGSTSLCALALAASLGLSSAAYAQDTDPAAAGCVDADADGSCDTDADGSEATQGTIVVTGSRIQRPNNDSTVPITTVDIQELTDTGDVSLGDALNELPSMRATFSQANSTGFIGTSGVNYLDLRGLGTTRTLVLVNGLRHVPTQPGITPRVDVNTIPVDLVERIDIVTGGNSAIYGSDAVAGVVNFILKRNFDGIKFRAQGGVSDEHDRGTAIAALTVGKNFAEGRGNVAVSGEWAFSNDLYYSDRDELYGAFTGRNQFQQVDSTLGEPAAGDGIIDFEFRRGIRNMAISDGGAYGSTCPAAVAGNAANALRRSLNCTGQLSNTGAELGRVFVFDEAGNLVPNIPTIDYRTTGSGNGQGGLGSSLRLRGQLIPKLERKAINLLAHFDVSDAFRPFLEAKYVRIKANQEGQPTSIANLGNTFSINNAFLTTQARTLLTQSLAPGAQTFSIQRFNVDFGGRGENHLRETFRVVGGIDGTFNDDWNYQIALNYGRFTSHMDALNRVNKPRFLNAIDAVRNSANNIVCAINNNATTADDDPNCVPINVFGFGQPSQAALNYIRADVTRDQKAEQFEALATVAGDLSQLFELPGGPIGFALGAEYREDTGYSVYDDVTTSGVTDFNIILPFFAPKQIVKEAFGEIRIPLLADRPFFHELTLEGAGRVSNYNIGATGTVWTYNLGATYAPVPDIRFRASYAKAVRAPTQSDLAAPLTQTFGNGFIDPCSQANINNGTSTRVANCAAAGVPTTEVIGGVTRPWTNLPSGGIRGQNGSNVNLRAETAYSLTVGAVAQPQFIPGLTMSLDYYRIRIEDVIFSLDFQTLANQCYDAPSGIDNQYCAAIFRRPDGTFFGQATRQVAGTTVDYVLTPTERGFIQGPFNFARQVTSGVDFDVNYRGNVWDDVKLDLHGIVSYVIRKDNYTDINVPTFRDQQLYELGDPKWAASFTAGLDFGKFDLTYNLRYVGKMTIDFFETQNPIDGRAPTDADKYAEVWYPDVFYHGLRLGFKPEDTRFRFYVGVDNLTDVAPPYGLDGTNGTGITGGTGAIYDNVGRFFYAGAEFRL